MHPQAGSRDCCRPLAPIPSWSAACRTRPNARSRYRSARQGRGSARTAISCPPGHCSRRGLGRNVGPGATEAVQDELGGEGAADQVRAGEGEDRGLRIGIIRVATGKRNSGDGQRRWPPGAQARRVSWHASSRGFERFPGCPPVPLVGAGGNFNRQCAPVPGRAEFPAPRGLFLPPLQFRLHQVRAVGDDAVHAHVEQLRHHRRIIHGPGDDDDPQRHAPRPASPA